MDDDEILEAVTVARHPNTGEYFGFHRRWGGVRGHVRRLVAVATSRDFTTWASHDVCLVPDELDDAWCQEPGQRTEFYGMSGFVYGDQFLGFLPVFDVIKDARGESGMPASVAADGSSGLQAPGSDIGVGRRDRPGALGRSDCGPARAQPGTDNNWHRFRRPFADHPTRRSRAGFDAGCILCSADRPIVVGDEVWHYYTAVNTMHGGPMPPKRISIGPCKMAAGRICFAGCRAFRRRG